MDNIRGTIVYVLFPDFSVVEGILEGETCDEFYKISTKDGRIMYKRSSMIFFDEKEARAKKFVKRFKTKLNHGASLNDAWNTDEPDIVDFAIDKWPEELL